MVWFFKSSELSVALTIFPASVIFEAGNKLFYEINQQVELLLLKCIH